MPLDCVAGWLSTVLLSRIAELAGIRLLHTHTQPKRRRSPMARPKPMATSARSAHRLERALAGSRGTPLASGAAPLPKPSSSRGMVSMPPEPAGATSAAKEQRCLCLDAGHEDEEGSWKLHGTIGIPGASFHTGQTTQQGMGVTHPTLCPRPPHAARTHGCCWQLPGPAAWPAPA